MRAEDFNIDELCDILQGTCESLGTKLEQMYPDMVEEDLTTDELFKIDSTVFLCETCGWWCEISEMADNGEWICQECADDE